MQYISPFSLLPNKPSEGFTKKDLILAKRKLLAEFELQGTPTIDFNGKEFSKNDVLNFFESLEKSRELDYHLAVAEDANLLAFLEKQTITHYARFSCLDRRPNSAFIEWISPYFRDAFKTVSLRLFKEEKYYELDNLAIKTGLMTAEHVSQAWVPLQNYLRRLHEELERINEKNNPSQYKDEIAKYTRLDFIKLINLLPQEHFSNEINMYAYEMMRSSIMVFNKMDNDWGMAIIQNALKLNVDESTREMLNNKEDEMNGIIVRRGQPNYSSNTKDTSTWTIIRVIFFW